MADTKISALTAASTPTGPEQIPAVQSGGNVALTLEQLGMALIHPGYVASRWYAPSTVSLGGGSAMAADTIKLYGFFVPRRITISDLGVRIVTASTGGHIRLGIYASSSTTHYPTGTPLSTCVVATDSIGTVSATLGANVSLNAGWYYFAAQADNSTVVCNAIATATVPNMATMMGDPQGIANVSVSSNILLNSFTLSVTYATGLSDVTTAATSWSAPTAATAGQCPYIFFKVASVP